MKAKVLVLEDDKMLATNLESAIKKEGHDVVVVNRAEDAQEQLRKARFNIIFVDCLLPGQSGVDFIESIRSQYPPQVLTIVLMSGIFTDASFVKDALRSTHAVAFLKKPFDLKEALQHVKGDGDAGEKKETPPRKALYQLFGKPKISAREKRKTIEALEEIHGYDLPYIYNLLIDSKSSGHLNIVGSKGEVSGITFAQGVITQVDIVDQETFLGKLLIESGYIMPDDLESVLSVQSTKRIGERLIGESLLSPHAFNIVLANQMNIRLSRTIVDASIRINFVATDVEVTYPHIDADALQLFLHDWIASKITPTWLKAHYMQWNEHPLLKGPAYQADSPVLKAPLVASLPHFVEKVIQGLTLSQIMDSAAFPEETAFKALHFLLTKGFVTFGEEGKAMNAADRGKFLRKIFQQFNGKNKVEIFDLMVRMVGGQDSDPHYAYNEFMKLLGDEPSPDQKELVTIYPQLRLLAQQAYDFVRTGNREKVREEIAKNEIELKLKAASQFEEAKSSLQRNQFAVALQLMQKAAGADPHLSKLRLYLAWAKIGAIEVSKNKSQTLKEIEMDLMQIPPEEKFDALYFFVNGLFYKSTGDVPNARKSIEKAIALDGTMIAAKRELSILSTMSKKQGDMLNRDLKDLVAGFFKKKTG